jgi:hypothetical protein
MHVNTAIHHKETSIYTVATTSDKQAISRLTIMSTVVLKLLLTFCCGCLTTVLVAETSNDKVCQLYLAPSLTTGFGRGVFAGISIQATEMIEYSVTIAVEYSSILGTQLNNYVWGTWEPHIRMAEFGPGMFFNHRYPPVMRHKVPFNMRKASDQRHAHTTSTPVLNVAERDISVGEEIFVSYSDDDQWFKERGIVVADVPESSYPPPVRTLAELEEIGHCLTHVKV